MSGRKEGCVCLGSNLRVSVSGPRTIPRKCRKMCCKPCTHLLCKTARDTGHQNMLLLLFSFAKVSVNSAGFCGVGLSYHKVNSDLYDYVEARCCLCICAQNVACGSTLPCRVTVGLILKITYPCYYSTSRIQ